MIRNDDPYKRVVIGWDIGNREKPTGICVAQTQKRDKPFWDGEKRIVPTVGQHFLIRFLERLPAGKGYPEIVDRLVDIICQVQDEDCHRQPRVKVNVTGGTVPVVDTLDEALRQLEDGEGDCWIQKVFVGAGDRRELADYGEVKLGKAWMVNRLQVLLQFNRVHMGCKNPMFKEMARDLGEFQLDATIDPAERGIFRVGRHDELITALGLALQEDVSPPGEVEIF